MSRSKLDPNQISQCEHDDDTGAKKVKIIGTEMSIELDAEDGDSVLSLPQQISSNVFDEEIDAKRLRAASLQLISGNASIEVSLDGVNYSKIITINTASDLKISTCNIAAKKIKITSTDPANSEAIMVGRS